ncbi:MAG: 4-hydroxythreonine-4-phosphate dehydrogenase PdxA [Akkermansiaceae bacterium]|nr:4-hydroxythreonine-4-phosphate dehydrogenase PdxA [Akkermansiaceae bacterium]MCP5543941.1 4-hydroxythreonine-4-phosphate dehydrogenase PdxA [Akkermansiaceae bacterium]MCP5547573.1 4-hydroxythreonine-4-phosphate dehydrogenase PdxA [Akkermansiaceae bacterium]
MRGIPPFPLGIASAATPSSGVPRIAITLGDPAGIGPETIDRALESSAFPNDPDFVLIGDRNAGRPGRPDAASARAALAALDEASSLLRSGAVDAVVTGPVCKESLQSQGFTFPGQTEFFAAAFGVRDYGMLLTGDTLTVGLATIHEPLARVPELLSIEAIERIGLLTAGFLRRRGIDAPRIAVAALNPHAGENGTFGDEEIRVIRPAIDKLNESGHAHFHGPGVPDSVFRDAARGTFDAVVAMYHDQGLIPLKLLDFENAVNVTLGLPRPRTSPDHGTAFDIAGKNLADPSSMISAIRLACELA